MNNLLDHSKRFLNKNASTILTCVGGVGVIATSVMAVKATPKALILLEKSKEEKGNELTNLEKIRVAGPVYIPTIITGLSTIACIFGANVINKQNQAALMSAYALLDNSYKEYKKKVIDLYGEDVDKDVRISIAKDKYDDSNNEDDGKQLFYDQYSNRYFRATNETVLKAEYEINRRLADVDCYASLNEFYELLGIPTVDYGNYIGWSSTQMFEIYWSSWINFNHEKFETDDGLEGYIISFTEPTVDFEDY